MRFYSVQATVVHHTTDSHGLSCECVREVPKFLLEADTHGIVNDEHAKEIVKHIICPVDLQYESITVDVNVTSFEV